MSAPPEYECEECGGEGQQMEMVCYGGPPLERWFPCPHCDGEGTKDPDEYARLIEEYKQSILEVCSVSID